MNDIQNTLIERGNRYGDFETHAAISQELKDVCCKYEKGNLTASHREALSMIMHKVGRIINGDPNYDDSWRDIAGYATLIVNQLNND